ncbi:MAG: hypothetical protein ACKVI9_07345, partial [Gammaproteobacteria bacterium]
TQSAPEEKAQPIPSPIIKQSPDKVAEVSIPEIAKSSPSHLDLKGWNAMFNSLELSMFVKQVFSEFEFLNFENKILTLKKSDDLI